MTAGEGQLGALPDAELTVKAVKAKLMQNKRAYTKKSLFVLQSCKFINSK